MQECWLPQHPGPVGYKWPEGVSVWTDSALVPLEETPTEEPAALDSTETEKQNGYE